MNKPTTAALTPNIMKPSAQLRVANLIATAEAHDKIKLLLSDTLYENLDLLDRLEAATESLKAIDVLLGDMDKLIAHLHKPFKE